MALVYLAAVWLVGLYLGLVAVVPAALPPLVAACAVALGLIWWQRPSWRFAFVALAVAALAFYRAVPTHAPLSPNHLAHANGSVLTLRGTVESEPEVRRGSQRLLLRAHVVEDGGVFEPVEGLVYVTTSRFPAYRYGEELRLTGRLEEPPVFDGFAYRDYLARQGVHSLSRFPRLEPIAGSGGDPLRRALYDLRASVRAMLGQALPEPQAALAAALLLGDRADMPDDLVDGFRTAGVSHVLAVSGWQVTLVVGLVAGIGGRVLRRHLRLRFCLACALVAFYVVLVGASPAVVRAGLMGGAALCAVALGRPRDGLSALALACFLATAWEPSILLDVGFRLSALATLGLVVLAPRFRWLEGRLPGWVGAVLGMTIAAELMVLPLLAAEFNRVSLVSLAANLAVVPLVPGGMEWATVAALLGSLWPPLALLPAALASAYLGLVVWVVEALAAQPWAAATVPAPPLAAAFAYYTALALLADGGRHSRRLFEFARARLPAAVPRRALMVATAALALAASGLVLRADGALRVFFLDVGQGDAILIRTPQGRHVLVDGGPDAVGVQNALGRRLPLGAKALDLVVLTHAHDDHLVGLIDVLQTHRVEQVLLGPDPAAPSPASRRWRELLATLAIPTTRAQEGQAIDLGGGARLRVLHAGEAGVGGGSDQNDASLALALERGAFTALLPGDGGPDVQRRLLDQGEGRALTLLKAPHHGATGSLDLGFLLAARPREAVISVGRSNRFGHPASETLAQLAPAAIHRTDLHGSIEFAVFPDGTYRVEHAR